MASVTGYVKSTSGQWQTITPSWSCGNLPKYYTRETVESDLSWYYSTGPSAWCTDQNHPNCGSFDVSDHTDGYGRVNSIACHRWVC